MGIGAARNQPEPTQGIGFPDNTNVAKIVDNDEGTCEKVMTEKLTVTEVCQTKLIFGGS